MLKIELIKEQVLYNRDIKITQEYLFKFYLLLLLTGYILILADNDNRKKESIG